MRWLRERLTPPDDTDTAVDEAKYRQRQKVQTWDRVYQSISDTERSIRGERRRADHGHVPERRHG